MADCTKTVDFLRERYRMCGALACADCPENSQRNGHGCLCHTLKNDYPEDAIAIVQKWSDEHQVQTWAGKLKELLPHAPIAEIMDDYCPAQIFGNEAPKSTDLCESQAACAKCWNSEYKEAT